LGKIRFNDKVFKDQVGAWVGEVDDADFLRAWEVVLGCLAVHAKLDRQPRQSAAQARREAYQDFALAFEGDEATYTMVGMLHEFEQMCPEDLREDGTFQEMVERAIALARGEEPARPPEGSPVPGSPNLSVIEGGRS